MTQITRKRLKPKVFSNELKDKIISLHRTHFEISSDFIIAYMQERDYIDVYFSGDRVIGTVGFQWYFQEGSVIMYMGNVVIDKQFKNQGITSRSYFYALLWTFVRYPHLNCYSATMATSPEAYAGVSRLVNYWPRHDQAIPKEILTNIQGFLDMHCPHNYIKTGNYFIVQTSLSTRKATEDKISASCSAMTHRFNKLNPNFKNGDQLPIFATIDIANVLRFIKIALAYKHSSTGHYKSTPSTHNVLKKFYSKLRRPDKLIFIFGFVLAATTGLLFVFSAE